MWRTHERPSTAARIGAGVAAVFGVAAMASPASAATDDTFTVETADRGTVCQGGGGGAYFVDFGDGEPGGGSNDDYIEVHDFCPDGHGVRAWAWLNGDPLGSKYDGGGTGSAVIWDPFKEFGNVNAGDTVKMRVCLVDGSSDTTPSFCTEKSHQSVDG